ncbi:MAG: transglycosylase SLT domain-containing protein [Saprospiraceae bacterium]|nr:transglycosylase SLT domain-containing protein [Saprospiraceae bacterium]
MQRAITYYAAFLSLVATFVLFGSFERTTRPDAQSATVSSATSDPGALPQVIRSVDLSKEYTFAGEVVPQGNFDAMERLDRELSVNSYWHSSTLLNIKQAHRYFPVIEPILAEHGVPDDFKYLAVAESNLRNAVSYAGAKGVWQFLKSTGQAYGLEINGEVDERYHLEKSTEAACRYLKDYYRQFGSWTLAAAAYNMGGPRLKRLLQEQQAESYYELNLNEETSRYVFRILAFKEILTSPEKFGFYVDESELYEPLKYRTVMVNTTVESWADFAQEHGTNYRMLKVYNPWLISGRLTCSGKKDYIIKLPPA